MSMRMYYILDKDKRVIPEPDLHKWAKWLESEFEIRRVALEEVGPYKVSTVFLGLDHDFGEQGPPILWETMVFGNGDMNQDQDRCSGTIEQAEAMHNKMVERVKHAQDSTRRIHGQATDS